jgi:hypothetical protein
MLMPVLVLVCIVSSPFPFLEGAVEIGGSHSCRKRKQTKMLNAQLTLT